MALGLSIWELLGIGAQGGFISPVKAKARTADPAESDSDERLVRLIGQGNRRAFSLLYNRYYLSVLGYIRQMLAGDKPAAEDLSQDVWEKMALAASGYKSQNTFTAWLFTIARNTALNELRRRGRWRTDEFDEEKGAEIPENEPLNAEELLIRLSNNRQLQDKINALPDRQRVALVAWLESDLSQKELAEQLGMTFITLRALLFRARKNLLEEGDS